MELLYHLRVPVFRPGTSEVDEGLLTKMVAELPADDDETETAGEARDEPD
jgi:hypothetical protein